jgi:hypothetical protein
MQMQKQKQAQYHNKRRETNEQMNAQQWGLRKMSDVM